MIRYVFVVLLFFACTINDRGDAITIHDPDKPIADIAIFIDNVPYGPRGFNASEAFVMKRLRFVKMMISALSYDNLAGGETIISSTNEFKIGFGIVTDTFVNRNKESHFEEVIHNKIGHGREASMVNVSEKQESVEKLLEGFVHNTLVDNYANRVAGIVDQVKITGYRSATGGNSIPRLVIWISPHQADNETAAKDAAKKLFEEVKSKVDIVFLLASIVNSTVNELLREYVAHSAKKETVVNEAQQTNSKWPQLQQPIKDYLKRCTQTIVDRGLDKCYLTSVDTCDRDVTWTRSVTEPADEQRYCFNYTKRINCSGIDPCIEKCKKAPVKPGECDAACEQRGTKPIELEGEKEWYGQYCPKPSPEPCTGPSCTTPPTTTTTTTRPAAAKQGADPFMLAGWQIAVIVIGGTLVLTIIVVIVVYLCMRYRPCDKERRLRKKHVHGFQQAGPGGGGGGGGHAHGGPPHGARGGGDRFDRDGGGRGGDRDRDRDGGGRGGDRDRDRNDGGRGGGGGGAGGRGGDRDREIDGGGRDRGGDRRGGGTDRRGDDSRRGGADSRR